MKDKLIGGGITSGTGMTGLAGMAAAIPEGITKIACVIGIFGTIVVIIVTLIKCCADSKIAELQIKKLKKEIGE